MEPTRIPITSSVIAALFFHADAGFAGAGIYRTDGTRAGTTFVSAGAFDKPVVAGDLLYFLRGNRLYRTDGTTDGTMRLRPAAWNREAWNDQTVVGMAGKVAIFFADGQDREGTEVWETDGTPTGTTRIAVLDKAKVWEAVGTGDRVTFAYSTTKLGDVYPRKLAVTDGTSDGTDDIFGTRGDAFIQYLAAAGTSVAFAVTQNAKSSIWLSNGTSAGTSQVIDDASPHAGVFGSKFLVGADEGDEAWIGVLDPADRSISKVWQSIDGRTWEFEGAVTVGRRAFIIVGDSYVQDPTFINPVASESNLWVTDGTAKGTKGITQLTGRLPAQLLPVAGKRLFFTQDYTVFSTDGTRPQAVANVAPAIGDDGAAGRVAIVGNQLFYAGWELSAGVEVFRANADAGLLAGVVFRDDNGNGVRDAGELPLTGWRVFIDKDNDSHLDKNEISTRTTHTGRYTFDDLPADATYRLRVTTLTGYAPSGAVAAHVDALNTTVKNVAVQRTAAIRGAVFNDANHNGARDAAEVGVAGFRVYLDLNGNGHFDAKHDLFVRTDADGDFEFDDLRAGRYWLRITQVGSWPMTTAKSFSTAVAPGGSASKRFGVRRV